MDSAAFAERLGLPLRQFEVVANSALGATMRRITLRFDPEPPFEHVPGQDLMITVPTADGGVIRRRYTISSRDPEASTLDLDMEIHGNGPGSNWAETAAAGDMIEGIGPRGVVAVDADADQHLFIGDLSYAPAAFAMAASPPASSTASSTGFVVIANRTADRPYERSIPGFDVRWIERDDPDDVIGELTGILTDLPRSERRHAYVGGEFHLTREIVQLLASAGWVPDEITSKPYWRDGQANAGHGEPSKDPDPQ